MSGKKLWVWIQGYQDDMSKSKDSDERAILTNIGRRGGSLQNTAANAKRELNSVSDTLTSPDIR